jgi:hypothetical protein
MRFGLDIEQVVKLIEWKKSRPISKAAMGEQYEYSFIPTGLGTICKVKCLISNEEIDLTDYDSW